MKDELEKIERRPIQYWYEDGIGELAFGAIGLCLGFYFWIHTWIPPGSAWHALWGVGMFPLLFFGFRFLNRAIRALKQKLTYPRTGYVSYRRPKRKRKRFSLLGGLVGAASALAYGILKSDAFPKLNTISWIALVTGLFCAAMLFWAGLKTDIPRFFVLAAISGTAGIALSVAGFGEMTALGAFWGILGASHCLSGAVTLLRYLRRNPSSGEERS